MSTTTNEVPKKSVIFIRGKRLNLRLITKEDIPTIIHWVNDGEVTQYLGLRTPMSYEKENEWVEKLYKDDKNFVFGIETKEGELIGNMGLHGVDYPSGVGTTGAIIGNKDFWGQGYGTEAKMLLLHYAFDTLNLRKVCSQVFAFNERSINYSKKCGYREEGRMRQHQFRNGEYHDIVLLAVFREDFAPIWEKFKKDNL